MKPRLLSSLVLILTAFATLLYPQETSNTQVTRISQGLNVRDSETPATVASNAGSITVYALQHMARGYTSTIRWDPTNVSGNVNINLTTDGWRTWSKIGLNVTNSGTFPWNVPTTQPTTTSAQLSVVAASDPTTSGFSAPFSIIDPTIGVYSVPQNQNPTVNASFSSKPSSSTEYQLICFSGKVDGVGVNTIGLPGNNGSDWRMFREQGSSLNPLSELRPDANYQLKTGEGYWLIAKGSYTQSKSYPTPTIGYDGTTTIQLSRDKYSVIGTPFTVPVSWSTIQALNWPALPQGQTLWAYDRGWVTATTLQPGKGYYINSTGVSAIKIPYPFANAYPTKAPEFELTADWRLQLVYTSETNQDVCNYVGIVAGSLQGKDDFESQKPPMLFDQSFLYMKRPAWDGEDDIFWNDYRPEIGQGQVWDFDITNPGKTSGTVSVRGVDEVPLLYDIYLVNEETDAAVDLRKQNSMPYGYGRESGRFKVFVGPKSFVSPQIEKYIPKEFALQQNYPNPFNPSTTITFRLPEETSLRLEVMTVLGQRVKVLAEGMYAAGVHQVVWSADNEGGTKVSSGVYFYRLKLGNGFTQVMKMAFTK